MNLPSLLRKTVYLLIALSLIYGASRLYFYLTGGFTVSNINSDLVYDSQWDLPQLSSPQKDEIKRVLNQEYSYLGKGCQSYVFASQDGKYVIKFFKYQRFRPQIWFEPFKFIPAVADYQHQKAVERKIKLDKVFRSWKVAYEFLPTETGIIYMHLNKSDDWHQTLVIKDKLGLRHELDLDHMEFLLQHRATMLCAEIKELMKQGKKAQAELLIDRLLTMLISEYARGFADNDHALMQNTGVYNGFPIHIDVGQFIYNKTVMQPEVYMQEIYDKTYIFQKWLNKHYPDLGDYLRARLVSIIGIDYFYKRPYVHKGDVGKIPHQTYDQQDSFPAAA